MHNIKEYIKEVYGKEPETLDQIAEAAIAIINHQANEDDVELVGFAWSIDYKVGISGYHIGPVGTTYTPNAHNEYPGFRGRVWLNYSKRPPSFSSSRYLEKTLTHTGTGGAGSYKGPFKDTSDRLFSYEYYLFLDDWPIIKSEFAKKTLWVQVKGGDFLYHHTYTWHKS